MAKANPFAHHLLVSHGAAFADVVEDDYVYAARRVNYIETHLAALARAIAHGVDLRGYFVWSLLDNFEWAWAMANGSASFTLILKRNSVFGRRARTGTAISFAHMHSTPSESKSVIV